MSELKPGIYETVLTEDLYRKLERISSDLGHQREDLTSVDIADRLARHIGEVTRRAIDSLPEDERVEAALKLTEALLKTVGTQVQDFEPAADTPRPPGSLLQSIAPVLPDGTQQTLKRPLIPLLDTTLLTNAPGEPRVGSQILEEIDTADRIDLIMAFIRRSGINPLEETLKRHCQAGKELRVLTTTFTGTTELKALERLQALGAKVKVSYDQSINRLHAKAWLFHRESGFTTAYIGSSNLTTAGQIRGLE
ncbi:MAG: phospholipase D-like domain-containing protein [Oligoflexia bacterium]|nr:phospholipase D-like domain-containing protein [Oligoflexia bacterium]